MVLPYDLQSLDAILQNGRVVQDVKGLWDEDLTESLQQYCSDLGLSFGHDFVVIKGGDTRPHVLVPLNGTSLLQPEKLGPHFSERGQLERGTFCEIYGQPIMLLHAFYDPYHRIHRP